MAQFFTHAGVIGLASDADLSLVPVGAVVVQDFDEATNPAVVADFAAGYSRFSVAAGKVRRDGVDVAFAADGEGRAANRDFNGQADAMLAGLDVIIGQAQAGMTNAQRDAAVLKIARSLKRTVRRVNRLGG